MCVILFNVFVFLVLLGVFLVLGIMFVVFIGGGDMLVVIFLLNLFFGLVVSVVGFVVMNNMLIIVGVLVGVFGIIFIVIMCKGMNCFLINVLFVVFGIGEGGSVVVGIGGKIDNMVCSIDLEEGVMMLGYVCFVVIVFGYGMVVV